MTLKFPDSFERWSAWEEKQNLPRYVKSRIKNSVKSSSGTIEYQLFLPELEVAGNSPILVTATSTSPTAQASLFDTARHFKHPTAFLVTSDYADATKNLTRLSPTTVSGIKDILSLIKPVAIVSLGQQGIGQLGHQIANTLDIQEFVIQHGVLVPFVPPLPKNSHLLAWSKKDSEYWRGNRTDLKIDVVGSQLLSQAAAVASQNEHTRGEGPVFLGQLHGIELPKRVTGLSAYSFIKEHGGLYRPHPSEKDVASRTIHKLMKRAGIKFQSTDIPLTEMPNPIVGVFSTGILEAAAKGTPAWVYARSAPKWVHELWDRYEMSEYGGSPTQCPAEMISENPALTAAELIESEIQK